jgi:hypothetical protein
MARSKSRLRQLSEEFKIPYSTLQRWTLEMIETQRKSVQDGGWPKSGEEMTVTPRGKAQVQNLAKLRQAGLKSSRAIALLEDLGALDAYAPTYWVGVFGRFPAQVLRISTKPIPSDDDRVRVVSLDADGFFLL